MSVRRRTTPAVAIAALLALGLTACGGAAEEEGDATANTVGAMTDFKVGDTFTATEPLDLSMLYSDSPSYAYNADWMVWDEITGRTNVTLDATIVPAADYDQKRSLLIGAGDAPSIIPKTYPGQETPFVASGAVLAVSDYVDLMPNFQAKVKEWGLEANLDTLRQADGKFYVLPGLHEAAWQDYTVAIRTDVMAELGLENPETWADFHDVLVEIKAAYPDSYPFSDRFFGDNILGLVAQDFGTSAGKWAYKNANWNPDSEEFEFTGSSAAYKETIEYFKSLVDEGLMDPESFTQDEDTAIQKFTTGKSFAISTNAQIVVNDYRAALTSAVPGATVAKIPLPGDAIVGTSRLENGIMLNANVVENENFVAMMQFIDWLWYSDEGQEMAKWGVEGTTYTKDADGAFTLAADIDYVGLNPTATKHLQKDFGFAGGVFAYGGTTALLQSTFSDEEIAFQDEMLTKELSPIPPSYPFDELEREQVTLWETPLTDYAKQMALQFILGQRDLDEWDDYVSELEGKGSTDYIDLVNSAHERFEETSG
ncbi:ABC transporter substrate-binding protein [Pengzhenrongella sicca]|uniref:Extracellular solute-binding protein n=1 Tax=Pengzhenrongella sicca TaxID=2819238 RepID=A0A8A4ZEE0_9MICO|nr:extracellular solute-binding protein [Pengzhenrongella sicca]QTE29389.1 extracellular solute-binding protein [Pengzhenrongella sicca]